MKIVECADGGVMVELYRDPPRGQVNLRTIPAGATVGGHRHPHTNEWWVLVTGEKVWAQFENMGASELPLHEMLWVFAGTGHRITNGGSREAVLLFWRDKMYDPEHPDKEEWKDGTV